MTAFDHPIVCRGNVGMWQMPSALAAEVSRMDELMRACDTPIRTMDEAARLFRLAMPVVGGVEGFFVLPLDSANRPLSAPTLVSMGTERTTTAVAVGDVFRDALAMGAAAIIVAHNHPGGTLQASLDDILMTRELVRAAGLLGIKLLDHLIITQGGFVKVK